MFKPHQSQLKTSRVNIRTQLRSQHLKFREVGKGERKERKKMKKNQEISN
jgi:type IV secretory pathway VirD2 relaxase